MADCQHCNETSGSVSAQNFLISLGPLSFSRRAVLHVS